MYNTRLIPARFLILVAHFTILVTLLWSSRQSGRACLPENHPPEALEKQQTQLIVSLSLAIGMIVLEFLGFIIGVTMFHATSALLSVGCHATACIILTYLVFDGWHCAWYWFIFGTCSVLPVTYDTFIAFDVFVRKKY